MSPSEILLGHAEEQTCESGALNFLLFFLHTCKMAEYTRKDYWEIAQQNGKGGEAQEKRKKVHGDDMENFKMLVVMN